MQGAHPSRGLVSTYPQPAQPGIRNNPRPPASEPILPPTELQVQYQTHLCAYPRRERPQAAACLDAGPCPPVPSLACFPSSEENAFRVEPDSSHSTTVRNEELAGRPASRGSSPASPPRSAWRPRWSRPPGRFLSLARHGSRRLKIEATSKPKYRTTPKSNRSNRDLPWRHKKQTPTYGKR